MEQLISLLPEHNRLYWIGGVAAIVFFFAITKLIQWRTARRVEALSSDGRLPPAKVFRRTDWFDWPYPLGFMVLSVILAAAIEVSLPLALLMVVVGLAAGCLVDAIVSSASVTKDAVARHEQQLARKARSRKGSSRASGTPLGSAQNLKAGPKARTDGEEPSEADVEASKNTAVAATEAP